LKIYQQTDKSKLNILLQTLDMYATRTKYR